MKLPIVTLLTSLLALGSAVAADGKPAKPNFLFVIADDCTFRDLGCYGGQAYTPNIDRLAGQGMRFTQCFQAAPMCSPTRHNIYTGLYPVKSGAYPNHTFASTAGFVSTACFGNSIRLIRCTNSHSQPGAETVKSSSANRRHRGIRYRTV